MYVTQYMFQRAYGNYLGLSRLGRFMAHEMGLRLDRIICIATPAVIGSKPKKKLKPLVSRVRDAVVQFDTEGLCA